jgi:hypothetical protein
MGHEKSEMIEQDRHFESMCGQAGNLQASSAPQALDAVEQLATKALRRRYRGPTCQALTKAGKPCGAGATASSAYTRCFHHDESIARSEKLAAVTRGGLIATRSYAIPEAPDPELATPDQIEKAIEETAGRVLRGDLAPSIAVALTGLYNAALRTFEMNIARRVAELEQLAASRAKGITSRRIIVDGQED